jgi:hypothetical protein
MTLSSFLKSIIYFSLAVVPALAWYVSDSTFFPFITGKNFAFRTLIEISFISWIILAVYEPSFRPKKSLVFYSYSAFLLIMCVANIFGDNPYFSFFGNYERMEGWFTHLHLFAYFTILYSVYKTEKDWLRMWGWFMVGSIAVAAQALLQLFGQKEFFLIKIMGENGIKISNFLNPPYPTSMGNALRIDSTLGNSEYYGVYTLLFIFISLMLAVKMDNWKVKKGADMTTFLMVFVSAFVVLFERLMIAMANNSAATAPGLAKFLATSSSFFWYAGIIMLTYFGYSFAKKMSEGVVSSIPLALFALLNVILLLFTQQRGSYLGLIGGVFVSVLAFMLSSESRNKNKKLAKYLMVSVSAVVLFVASLFVFKDADVVKNSVIIKRISTIKLANIALHPIDSYKKIADEKITYPELVSHFGEATIVSRFLNAKMSIDGVNDNPKELLLGHGQENYGKVFAENFDPRMYAQEAWFDRAHNVFMDWLVAGGILGLLAYLALYMTPIYMMWCGKGSKNMNILERLIITGALAGYFIHNVFVFDNLISYIMFVAILAYVASITRVHEVKEDVIRKENKYAKYIVISASILISLYLFIYTVLFPLMSNLDILSSLRNSPTSYADIAANTNKNIKSFSSAVNRNDFGRLEANEQMLQQASRLVLVDLTQMEEKDKIEASKSIQEFKTLAELSFSKVIADEPTARNTSFYGTYMRSIGQYEKSLSLLEVANSMAPNKQLINLEYATVLAGTGQLEKGLEIAKRSYESEPTFETSKSVYENIKKIADTNKLPKPKSVIKK